MDKKQIEQIILSLLPDPYKIQIGTISIVDLSHNYKIPYEHQSNVRNVTVKLKESAYLPSGGTFVLCKQFDDKLYLTSQDLVISILSVDPGIQDALLKEVRRQFVPASSFGCCSRYHDCSDQKKCVHPNPFYSFGCTYRQRIESGHIYFGVNRNV